MVAESSVISRAVAVRSSRNGRRAPVQIDKRFAIGRRIKELTAVFRGRVGLDEVDPDPVLSAAVEKAARLTALAEDAAARALRADPKVSLDDVVRLTRLADLSVRRLHLDRRNTTPATPTLSAYLAQRGERVMSAGVPRRLEPVAKPPVAKPTTLFFTDGYRDKPTTRRGELVERIRQLKMQHWADPGDAELRTRIAEVEAELQALDLKIPAREVDRGDNGSAA
jgi:hypothetical protein